MVVQPRGADYARAVTNALERRLRAEWLDQLPAHDPRVIRCRRDLRLINWLMGNHRWIMRQLAGFPGVECEGIIELGAGDGALLCRIHRRWPARRLTGIDLAPRPDGLPTAIQWRTEDVLGEGTVWPGGILLCNLVLHHFSRAQIESLAARTRGFQALIICESLRDVNVLRRSRWLHPLLGDLTQHDMEVSLEAGFLPGELPLWLGLNPGDWTIRESSNLFGAHRLLAVRRRR